MPRGKLLFSQIMLWLPLRGFHRIIDKHKGDFNHKGFTCLDQFLAMAISQLTSRSGLRGIEDTLKANTHCLYHMGFRCGAVARNTLAHANATRPWQIYAELALLLIGRAKKLYAAEPLAVELKSEVFALDSTTIDLCLAQFPWCPSQQSKSAVKLHTLLNLRGNIPEFIVITGGKTHDVNILDQLEFAAGAYYIMDRGYLDFARLCHLHLAKALFVTRAKRNLKFRVVESRAVDKNTGLLDTDKAGMAQSVSAHLHDYEANMKAKGCDPRHIRQEISKIKRTIEACRFRTHSDINANRLHAWLARQREEKDMGARTANSYGTAFKSFCNWMIPDRASVNPLEHLPRFNERVDVRRERRALNTDELRRLITAAEFGQDFRGMPGYERSLLYRVAMETGLRWSELRSLKRLSFELSGKTPAVTVEAAYSKHRKEDVLALRKELAETLRSFFAESLALPASSAFPHMPESDVGAKMIRFDLARTGDAESNLEPVPYADAQGRVADFHALRHSFITSLARSGVHPSVAQALARHSTITLTMDRYTHSVLENQQEAIERLPDLSLSASAEKRETGTDAADSAPKSIAQILPNATDRHPFDLDTSGQSPLAMAAGAESLNSLPDNEKALQTQGLQGFDCWHPHRESNPSLQTENLSS